MLSLGFGLVLLKLSLFTSHRKNWVAARCECSELRTSFCDDWKRVFSLFSGLQPFQQNRFKLHMLSLIPEPSQELTVPRNCSELKTKQKITSDGEYKLGLQYPFCNNTVDVYCADMNTSTPKEYITLKAGDTNNYSKKNYVSSVKSSIWASARTNFAKVTKYSFEMRINFSYLNKLLN